jgi:hypothetical protein
MKSCWNTAAPIAAATYFFSQRMRVRGIAPTAIVGWEIMSPRQSIAGAINPLKINFGLREKLVNS